MSELTAKDLNWFRLANSNPPHGFYEFKDRFLKRFAVPDGFDLQVIEKQCWSCDGTGKRFCAVGGWNACDRCCGSGVYSTNRHWLKRYNLGGAIYHKSLWECDARSENGGILPEPKELIEGRIIHASVETRVAHRAFYRLLIRHEPITFYNKVTEDLKSRLTRFRAALVWKLIRLRNKMDLFPAIKEDEVPF